MPIDFITSEEDGFEKNWIFPYMNIPTNSIESELEERYGITNSPTHIYEHVLANVRLLKISRLKLALNYTYSNLLIYILSIQTWQQKSNQINFKCILHFKSR